MLASSLAKPSRRPSPTLAGRQPLQVACSCRSRAGTVSTEHSRLQLAADTVGCRFALLCGRAPLWLCAPWALSSHTVILRAGHYFFRNTLVKNHHRSTDDLHLIHTAIHVLGIIHSHSDSDSTHDFAPPRGVATRRFRQPIADLGHMKGWLHWRLLGLRRVLAAPRHSQSQRKARSFPLRAAST